MTHETAVTPIPDAPGPSRRLPTLTRWLLLIGLFAFFVVLHGRLYDGDALKQAMWDRVRPGINEVNHPYSSLWYWYWWKLVEPWAGTDFDQRMTWLAGLNALLGAAGAVLAASILSSQGVRTGRAVLTALGLAATNAWFYHSTQTTEPMMGEFFFLLSLRLLLVTGPREQAASILAALSWATSVAAYQSYILAGPGLLLLVWTRRSRALLWVTVAGAAGVVWFAVAAFASGAHDLAGMVHYITAKPDGNYWGEIRLSAVPQVPVGLANAVSPPWPTTGWEGLRASFHSLSTPRAFLLVGQVVLTVALTVVICARRKISGGWRLRFALLAIFAAGLFPPFYLLPYYNKLWLLPLSAIVLLGGLAAGMARQGGLLLALILSAVLVRNSADVYLHFHQADNPRQLAARAVEESVTPDDLLVCDGWDHSSLVLARRPQQRAFSVMREKPDPKVLADRVDQAQAQGRRVFFFGLLELTPQDWALSDMAKRGTTIPYDPIQAYKARAALVWRGEPRGFKGDLYEVKPSPPIEVQATPAPP